MKPNRIRDIYPLAPLQQGMLFHSLSDAVPGMYCEQVVGEVTCGLDAERFRDVLAHLVKRHDALRSAFVWQDVDEPLQVVQDDAIVPLTTHDWTASDAADRAGRLEALLEHERRRGFDLGMPPLMRADLARTATGDLFVLTFHHAILDGWSVSILLRELIAIYEGLGSGAVPRLAAARPFRDFMAWLRARDTRGSEAFWGEELRGFTTPTPIVDSLLSRGERFGSATHAEEIVRLPVASTDAVRAAARRSGVTLNTFVQGAWALLLSLVTGEDDVVFGALVSGRPPELPGVESMTGVFMNTVPVRARIDAAERVDAFLKALQARNGRLREHEHVPLARIQAATRLPRGQALFESVLVFENYPAEIESAIRETTGGTWNVYVRSLQLTNYPLHLMVVPGAELLLDLTCDGTAVSGPMAARLMGALRTLIETMAAQPEAPLGTLALQDRVAGDAVCGCGPARPRPPVSFRELFEAACAQHAGRPAARDGSRTWSYAELAARARAGAARLAALGAGPETVVALLGPRDVYYLAAVLAVLNAEAAFLPLDPHQPTARQLDILERSGVRVLVADPLLTEPLLAELRRRDRRPPVCVSMTRLSDPDASDSAWQPPSSAGPRQLAYVIFTSGSSGVPKGAMLEQRGLVNHLLSKVEELSLTPADVVAETAPACFDISIWQFLAPLLAGAVVHVCPDDIAFDGTRLLGEVDRAGITILETVPTLLQAMVDDLDRRGRSAPRLDRLRLLLSTGETLPADLCRSWLARFPRVPVVNAYGPTECSDDVTHHVIDVEPGVAGPVPIGRPLPNTGLRVMDHQGRELPAGFAGELYVGGDGVGRGYLGDPARTADAFVECRVNGRAERLYRTGDRVRLRADGVFEYVGRRDDQVKIHGHRIELGEIEARLAEHPAIGAAAVVAAPSISGTRLVAFVTERAAAGDDALRSFLRRVLPDYMVPSAFIRREVFPVTPNGKLDRRALAAEAPQDRETARAVTPPRDEVEATLAGVWADVLRRDVGIDRNFFELGGDSILIMQVVSRAMQDGLPITVRQMFEHQTVEGVARAVRGGARPLTVGEAARGPAPLTPVQAWFFELDIPRRHHWNMSLRLTTRERLDAALIRRTVEQVMAHHDALRLRFSLRSGSWSADPAHGPDDICTLVDASGLSAAAREERQRGCEQQLQASLDLDRGSLLRVALFDGGVTSPSELLFVVHHLVADAVSLRILLEDFETAYLALREGRTPVLPPTTASFTNWARHLRAHADSDAAGTEWDYWLEVGADKRARLNLDDRAAANSEADARVHEVSLEPAETEALIRSLPARGITAHDALLAALAETLSLHSSDGEIVVDVEGHGRHGLPGFVDVTRTVGWFTALYPLALGPSRTLGIAERHAVVRPAREQVANGGIGYGLLRYFGSDPVLVEALRAVPTPEVSFNYFGQVDAAFAGSALFTTGREGHGPDRDPEGTRPHLLDVSSGVFDGRLRLLFLHAAGALRHETISAIARDFVATLRALLTASESVAAVAQESRTEEPLLARARSTVDVPLSFAQRGLWFIEQARPGTPVSNSSAGFRLEGPLDVDSLQRAIDEIVRRHEPLRVRFRSGEGVPAIVEADDTRVRLDRQEWPGGRAGTIAEHVARWAESEARRPFDLAVDPPFRMTLLRLAADDHVLVVTGHHIAFDGWSFGVFGRELLALYSAFREGRPSPLAPLTVEYSDFARWQSARLRGPRLTLLLDYWRRRLDGAPALHDLPLDHVRPAVVSFAGRHLRRTISAELSDVTRAYAQAHGTTLFVVLLTAFNLALARRSSSRDILIGAAVAGRRRPELEALIGVFVNTVVLRTDLAGIQTFDAALERTAATVIDGLQHEELPFELLVQDLRPGVRTSNAPIVQIGFAMQNMPMPRFEVAGLRVTPLEIDNGASRADLVLFAVDAPDGIRLSLEHSTDVFDPATAERLLLDVERCLEDGVSATSWPEASELGALADAQVDALLRQLVEPS